jgi:phospholipid-transporting ATPase
MKQFSPDSVTLAIGDGSNDVSMIMEANVGIGIMGEEGMSAAKASDFSIGEFKLLKRLLFFHGRTNLNRISNLILYFFYKNIIFTISQLFFGPFSLLSGQTIIDDWYITCYNLVFTALPLCIAALTDIDLEEADLNKKEKELPLLYKESRDEKIIFRRRSFVYTAIKGIIVSFIMYAICVNNRILCNKGHIADLWYLSLLYYLSILFVVTNNLFFTTHYIVNLLLISVGITTFLFLIIFLIFVHYGLVFDFKSKATILPSVRNLSFYVYLFFSIGFNLVLDYTLKLRNFLFDKHLSTELFRQKTMKSKEKKKQLKYKRSERNFNNNEISGMNLMNKNSILQGYHFNDHERISYFNKNNLAKITVIKRSNSKGVPEKIFKFKKDKKSNEGKESSNS